MFSCQFCGHKCSVNAPATAADVERTLTLPAAPRLILLGMYIIAESLFALDGSGETPGNCIQHWMISLEEHIICEGIEPSFLSGLAALFSAYYNFNLQYQAEAACTLEFIQRRFIGITPEKGTKAAGVMSKKTGKVTQKKKTLIPHDLVSHQNNLLKTC